MSHGDIIPRDVSHDGPHSDHDDAFEVDAILFHDTIVEHSGLSARLISLLTFVLEEVSQEPHLSLTKLSSRMAKMESK